MSISSSLWACDCPHLFSRVCPDLLIYRFKLGLEMSQFTSSFEAYIKLLSPFKPLYNTLHGDLLIKIRNKIERRKINKKWQNSQQILSVCGYLLLNKKETNKTAQSESDWPSDSPRQLCCVRLDVCVEPRPKESEYQKSRKNRVFEMVVVKSWKSLGKSWILVKIVDFSQNIAFLKR